MNLAGKKLAVLGGTRICGQIVSAAKELGVHVTVIDPYDPSEGKAPAKLMADEHAEINVADIDAVVKYLKEHHIEGVTTGYTDSILGYYADICEQAGVPCYGTHKQFEIFTDKHLWKDLCRNHGIPTALEYGKELLDKKEEEIDFPIFVKPSDASGARGATVAHNKKELMASYELAKGFQKNGEVLFEKYLDGPEVTVFWVFIDGNYYVNMLGNRHVKHNQEGVIPLPAGYTFPASVIPRYLDEVAPKWRQVFSELGIRDGMMFMQCCVQNGLPYVYDIGYRSTGSLEHHIQKAVAGYSTTDMLIHHALTGRMTDDSNIKERIEKGLYSACFNISWLMRPGTISHFEGLDHLDNSASVIGYFKAHVEGETLPQEAIGQLRQIVLRCLGSCQEIKDVPSVVLALQNSIDVIDINGNSLLLPGLDLNDFNKCMLYAEN